MKLTIRNRLTILNSLTVALLLVFMALALVFIYRQILVKQMKEKLDSGYETVVSVLNNSGGDVYDIYHLGQEIPTQIKKGDEVLWQTNRWNYLKLQLEDRANPGYVLLHDFKQDPYLVRIGVVKKFDYTVYFAQPADIVKSGTTNLVKILLLSMPIALILSVLSAHFLAGRSLQPIRETIRQAKEINTSSLDGRLPVINKNDELGELNIIINSLLDDLKNSFERLKQFTSDASHELRTPLTSIKTMGEVVLSKKDGGNNEEYAEVLSSILEEVDFLSNLVDDLLTLTRLEKIDLLSRFEAVDFSELVTAAISDMQVLADEKSQIINLDINGDLKVKGIKGLLQQAVSNVIHNAVKYSPVNGEITVRLYEEAKTVVLDVLDEGPGIKSENKEEVFERFFREDRSRSKKVEGFGLGLAIARQTVELHSGNINFVELNIKGSCCRLKLPSM